MCMRCTQIDAFVSSLPPPPPPPPISVLLPLSGALRAGVGKEPVFGAAGPGYEPCAKLPGAICLKELSFRSSDVRHAQKVTRPEPPLRSLPATHGRSGAPAPAPTLAPP